MTKIAGNRVIITGGARGAGRGIAVAFAEAGCDVVIADLLQVPDIAEAAAETARMVEVAGQQALLLACDVTQYAELEAVVEQAESEFGPVDHLVVNAGIIQSGNIEEMDPQNWSRVLDVNLTGAWLSCRAVTEGMKSRGRGSITIISSVAAKRGGAGYTAYCASKAGVLGMMKALSHELAPHDVRVNAILPGYLATEMWYRSILGGEGEHDPAARSAFDEVIQTSVPLGRPQTPGDLGEAAVYLAGAPNVTGAELIIDGGRLAGP